MKQTTDDVLGLLPQARTWPTIKQWADETGISGRTIRQAVADGRLPAVRLNVARISPEDFSTWVAARQRS